MDIRFLLRPGLSTPVNPSGTPAQVTQDVGLNGFSAQFNFAAATRYIIAHGIGQRPDILLTELVNVTGEHGFTTGETIPINGWQTPGGGLDYGVMTYWNAVNAVFIIGNSGIRIMNTGGTTVGITAGNWQLRYFWAVFPA